MKNAMYRVLESAMQQIGVCSSAIMMSLFLTMGVPGYLQAAPGDLDQSFGSGGKVIGPTGVANEVVLQTDGKILVGGGSNLRRYNQDGTLDGTFGSGGTVVVIYGVDALAVQSDGEVLTAGYDFNGSNLVLTRFNPDGGMDVTFGVGGRVMTSETRATSLVLQSDRKILTGTTSSLVRFNSDGTLDSTFGANGSVSVQYGVFALAIQGDGKIVTVGISARFVNCSPVDICVFIPDFAVSRYIPDGNLDTSFGNNGTVITQASIDNAIGGIAIQMDSKIVVAGNPLVRYNSDGSLDNTFGNGGIVSRSIPARGVALQPDGKILAVEWTFNLATSYDFAIWRYNSNGNPDSTFGINGRVITDFAGNSDRANSLALQPDRKIVVVGETQIYDPVTSTWRSNFALARYIGDPTPSCPSTPWTSRYNGSANNHDVAQKVVTDASCNTYVTGWSYNGVTFDYATVKYDANGNQLWVARYDHGAGDFATDLVVDSAGNVYVIGRSHTSLANRTYDYATVKYDTNGNQLWVARYDGPANNHDLAQKVAIDGSGNVYVTGWSYNGVTFDYATIKYDTNGNQLWVARYDNGVGDFATDLAVDGSGNVYVTGRSHTSLANRRFDYATVKYDANGTQLWVSRYNGPTDGLDAAQKVVVDALGNSYVTGWSKNGITLDYATVKYDANGNQLWVARYDNGGGDYAHMVRVDSSGNVYVTGRSHTSPANRTFDIVTIKYDAAGNQLWVNRYDRAGRDDMGLAMVLDASGNAIVTGFGNNGTNMDYLTIKYDAAGNQVWVNVYDNGGDDMGRGIAVDSTGNVYVTGWSNVVGGLRDYATIKYAP